MDRETLSHYGWIVILTLILAVLLAFATPFSRFIATAVFNFAKGLADATTAIVDNWKNGDDGAGGGNIYCNHDNQVVVEVEIAPTCTSSGRTAKVYCNDCKTITQKPKAINPLGHDFGEEVIQTQPTCTVAGLSIATCQRDGCGETVKTPLNAKGHKEELIPAVAQTCTKTGLTSGKKCSVCSETLVAQKTVPALGHVEIIDDAKDATCVETGSTQGKHCSRCKEILIAQEIIPALGHDLGEPTIIYSSCNAGGEERRECKRQGCDYFEIKTTDASGHKEMTLDAVAPTCTEPGLTEGTKCSVCGTILKAQANIDALGHDYRTTTIEPTCQTTGLEKIVCDRCGHVKSETTLPIIPHHDDNDDGKCEDCGGEIIPEGGEYYDESEDEILEEGDVMPETPETGDFYTYGDYRYGYNMLSDGNMNWMTFDEMEMFLDDNGFNLIKNVQTQPAEGWGVDTISNNKTSYGEVLEAINSDYVVNMYFTYSECNRMTYAPEIPSHVINMFDTYSVTTFETFDVEIPASVESMEGAFRQSELMVAPIIPDTVINIDAIFSQCCFLETYEGSTADAGDFSGYTLPDNIKSMHRVFEMNDCIVIAPIIPDMVSDMSLTFSGCENLTTIQEVPNKVTNMTRTFANCIELEGIITINSNVTEYVQCFKYTDKSIWLTTDNYVAYLDTLIGLAATDGYTDLSEDDNVRVRCEECKIFVETVAGEPICEVETYTKVHCTECGFIYSYESNPAPGHNMSTNLAISPSTCQYEGFTYYRCLNNKCMYMEIIGHLPLADHKDDDNDKKCDWCGLDMSEIPEGGRYYDKSEDIWLEEGDPFPEEVGNGDLYIYGDYQYGYNLLSLNGTLLWKTYGEITDMKEYEDKDFTHVNGWGVDTIDNNKETYENPLSHVNGAPVTNLCWTYSQCVNMIVSPEIPSTIKAMYSAFENTIALTTPPEIPYGVIGMERAFVGSGITVTPIIPETVENMFYAFAYCEDLTTITEFPSHDLHMGQAFYECSSLTGIVTVNTTLIGNHSYKCFLNTTKPIWLTTDDVDAYLDTITALAASDGYEDLSENDNVRVLIKDFGEKIPAGGEYYDKSEDETLTEGDLFPTPAIGDTFTYGDYEYRYGYYYYASDDKWIINRQQDGWGAKYIGTSEIASPPLTTIAGKNLVSMADTYSGNTTLKQVTYIPETVTEMVNTFNGCANLTTVPAIPSSVTDLDTTFGGCDSLTGIIEINVIADNILSGDYDRVFNSVDFQEQKLTLSGSCDDAFLDELGATGTNYCDECNGWCKERLIPSGGVYTPKDGAPIIGDGVSTEFPETPSDGDIYTYGNYEYGYNCFYNHTTEYSLTINDWCMIPTDNNGGWGVHCINNVANPGEILETIAGKPITSLRQTFFECDALEIAPAIPETVTTLFETFRGCTSLTTAPYISSSVNNMKYTFFNCTSLTGNITIDAVFDASAYLSGCFGGVDFKAQNITLYGPKKHLDNLGRTGTNYCDTCNGKCDLSNHPSLN